MKKPITLSVLLLGIVFLAGCEQQEKQNSTTFKETGIESEFTLPEGWTYEKGITPAASDSINKLLAIDGEYGKKDVEGLNQFSFYDQNHKEVGEISLFATTFDIDHIETSFDDCWRAWSIGSGEMNDGNQNGIITDSLASKFELDHYINVINDGLTSVATESCRGYGGHIAYIYWVPGTMVTNQSGLLEFYNKKPVRVMGIHLTDMNDDDFIQLIHNIAKSVTIKN
jgi:hypothetical protein